MRIPRSFVTLGGFALILAASVAAGAAVSHGDTIISSHGRELVLALATVVGLRVVAAGPVACIAAIAVIGVSWLRTGIGGGDGSPGHINYSVADLFYVALLGWLVVRAVVGLYQPSRPKEPNVRFGQWAALAFFAYLGLSVWHVQIAEPHLAHDSLLSWLRFVQTASLALLIAMTLRTPRDVKVVLGAVAIGGVLGVGSAIVSAAGSLGGVGSARIGGWLGVNLVGLVGGVLIAIGAFAGLGPRKDYRIALVVIGALGLLLGKSVGSIVGTTFMLAVGFSLTRRVAPIRRYGTAAMAIAVMAAFAIGMVQLLRPSNAPTGQNYRNSSTSQRIIVGAVGLQIFSENPVIGVGWDRSSATDVIGDPAVVRPVRFRFEGANDKFFPDRTPTTVHNAYVQLLAELGMVGFALFLVLLIAIFVATRRLLRGLGPDDPLWAPAWVAALSLLLTLVFMNDNPLYGGQVDTIVMAFSVGLLAASARMVARRRSSLAGPGPG